ncbi:hypothetical protein [Streptomyces sp. NPDC058268]|uniref:hypothetical protein n=1 Tax=Streptomyces sp. NPDC058268 TaxID=3346413 RepID=UPI0036ED6092
METALPFEPCTTCVKFAYTWKSNVGDGPVESVSRNSSRALFGLHVHTAHPAAPAPGPDLVNCADCRHLVTYVEYSGDDVEMEGACATSGDEVLHQHLLSHLIDRVPIPG